MTGRIFLVINVQNRYKMPQVMPPFITVQYLSCSEKFKISTGICVYTCRYRRYNACLHAGTDNHNMQINILYTNAAVSLDLRRCPQPTDYIKLQYCIQTKSHTQKSMVYRFRLNLFIARHQTMRFLSRRTVASSLPSRKMSCYSSQSS